MTAQFDAIVVGTGQAGPALAGRLSREGLKTAIIDRKLIGGTCVNVGCIPTKTLVGSAKVAAIRLLRNPDRCWLPMTVSFFTIMTGSTAPCTTKLLPRDIEGM